MEQNDPTRVIGNNKFERTSCGLWMVQTTKINQDRRSHRRKRTEPKTETKPPWLEPEQAKQGNYIKEIYHTYSSFKRYQNYWFQCTNVCHCSCCLLILVGVAKSQIKHHNHRCQSCPIGQGNYRKDRSL